MNCYVTTLRWAFRCLLLFSVAHLSGCAQQHYTTAVLSLENLKCRYQSEDRSNLQKTEGIRTARFDVVRAEVQVQYDQRYMTPPGMLKVIGELGFSASLGAGRGSYEKGQVFPVGPTYRCQSTRAVVELKDHVAPGKVTVFDFHADRCLPCKKVDRRWPSCSQTRHNCPRQLISDLGRVRS